MPIDVHRVVEVDGVEMAIKDIPDLQVRQIFGLGHSGIHPSRMGPGTRIDPSLMEPPLESWPYEILACPLNAPEDSFVWIQNGHTLVCPGCGLDGT